jgi:hypothetical protein
VPQESSQRIGPQRGSQFSTASFGSQKNVIRATRERQPVSNLGARDGKTPLPVRASTIEDRLGPSLTKTARPSIEDTASPWVVADDDPVDIHVAKSVATPRRLLLPEPVK